MDILTLVAVLTVLLATLTALAGIVKYNLDGAKHFDARLDQIELKVNDLANNYEILEQKINANRVGESLVLDMIKERFNAISDQLEFLKDKLRG
jgi:archaellum component FlaC